MLDIKGVSLKSVFCFGIITAITLAFVAFITLPVQADTATITGNGVNMRSGPGTNYQIIDTIPKGTVAEVLSRQDGWVKIYSARIGGWVSADYVQIKSTPKVTVTGEKVNLRSGPGTSYSKVGEASRGDQLTLVEKQGDWYKIKTASGTICYISADYAETTNQSAETPGKQGTATSAANPKVYLDNQLLNFEVPAIIENGRTLVPLRAIFEAMGAQVDWNDSTRTVVATKSGTRVILSLGSTTPTVNDQTWNLDVPAKIKNNRTLAPLRFVGEAFGGKVSWDDASKTVHITSPEDKGGLLLQ